MAIVRQSKLDLEALMKAGEQARARVATWPEWQREAVRAASTVFQDSYIDTSAETAGDD